jgi:hypothetical protein
MKPSHEKKKTRPWRSTGLKTGTERAFLLTGLRTGARQRSEALKPIPATMRCVCGTRGVAVKM